MVSFTEMRSITWPAKIYWWEIEALKTALVNDNMRWVAPAPLKPEPHKWSDDEVTCAWLGHSIVLINFFGLNIITDPVLGRRVGIKAGPFILGPKRYIQPALKYWELPQIDLILLSHSHLDHLDLWTLRRMGSRATVVTSAHTKDLMKKTWLTETHELAWHEHTRLFEHRGGMHIEAFPTSHWGARLRSDHHRGWNGYIIERNGKRLIFGGDTGYTSIFEGLREKGPFDIAIMPIGAYMPWITNHCNPEQALKMTDAAGAKYILPIHHQTFKLGWEPMHEPIERLKKALAPTPHRLAIEQVGGTFILPRQCPSPSSVMNRALSSKPAIAQ